MIITRSKIYIRSLRVHAFHGVLPQERVVGNDYVVDVSAEYDISRAVATDNVADTLNYADMCKAINDEMAVPSQLIEHVAGRVAERLFGLFPAITTLRLSITKVNPPMGADCGGAGVEIELTNDKN